MSTEPNGVLRRNSNVQTWISGILVLGAIFGWLSFQQGRLTSLEGQSNELEKSAQRSIDERSNLSKQVEEMRKTLIVVQEALTKEITERTAALEEVEVQFDSADQLRYVQFSDFHRTISIVWNKNPDLGVYPTAPFFMPNISKRHSK